MRTPDGTPLDDVPNFVDVGLIVVDVNQTITLWNDWIEAASSVAKEEALGRPIELIFPEIIGSPLQRAIVQALEFGLSHYLSPRLNPTRLPLRAPGNVDDIPGSMIQTISTKSLAVEGGPTYCLIQITDVSQATTRQQYMGQIMGTLEERVRERTEALAQSEERFSLALRGANEGLWDWNLETDEVFYSPRWARMTGYDPEEIAPTPSSLTALLAPEDKERYAQEVEDYVSGKTDTFETEFRLRHKDGSWVSILSRAFLVHKDGVAVRLVGTHLDITKRRALEERLLRSQRMDAIGQLTGGVAHDFNNLLAAMIGYTELLEDSIDPDSVARNRVDSIKHLIDRGTSLTTRLLAFSRQQTLSPQATDVSSLVKNLDELLRRTLGETVDLKTITTSDLWPVTIDPHQTENALINLALNARDAMPEGGTLTIRARNVVLEDSSLNATDEVVPGDYVILEVNDTGEGVTPEVMERMFEPFFTTKEVGAGSGLGLSMVYGFVKQSNGHAAISSEVGAGTTVKLFLPRSLESVEYIHQQEQVGDPETGSENILVVEDDPAVREISVEILRGKGYSVVEVENGRQAVELFNQGQVFDLLFTDVVLPDGMNGVQIAEKATAIQPDIKVLFTSGYAENVVSRDGRLDSSMTLINKPYRRAELLERVRMILDGKSG